MKKSVYEMQVLVNGRPIREYYKNGRFFVEARKEVEYEIRFRNNSGSRVLAAFSVDGVNVIDGQPAEDNDNGYVVNPYDSLTVRGYRIDDDNVASFVFGKGGESYASLKENGNNIRKAKNNPSENNGVIGVRVWKEKEKVVFPNIIWESRPVMKTWPPSDPFNWMYLTDNSITLEHNGSVGLGTSTPNATLDICCSSDAVEYGSQSSVQANFCRSVQPQSLCQEAPDFDLGTKWGDEKDDSVVSVLFERETYHVDLIIYYMTRDAMEDYGIDLRKSKGVKSKDFPKPFGGYCEPPANW